MIVFNHSTYCSITGNFLKQAYVNWHLNVYVKFKDGSSVVFKDDRRECDSLEYFQIAHMSLLGEYQNIIGTRIQNGKNKVFHNIFFIKLPPWGDGAGHWRAAFQWGLNTALGFYLSYIVSWSSTCAVVDGGIWYYWSKQSISRRWSRGVYSQPQGSLWLWLTRHSKSKLLIIQQPSLVCCVVLALHNWPKQQNKCLTKH